MAALTNALQAIGARAKQTITRRPNAVADLHSAVRDAVEVFDADMAAWMFANGISNPTAAEAARLRRLFERLVDQRRAGDFDGAVATWLETRLGSGVKPTRMERKTAAAKIRAFFDAAAAPGGGLFF